MSFIRSSGMKEMSRRETENPLTFIRTHAGQWNLNQKVLFAGNWMLFAIMSFFCCIILSSLWVLQACSSLAIQRKASTSRREQSAAGAQRVEPWRYLLLFCPYESQLLVPTQLAVLGTAAQRRCRWFIVWPLPSRGRSERCGDWKRDLGRTHIKRSPAESHPTSSIFLPLVSWHIITIILPPKVFSFIASKPSCVESKRNSQRERGHRRDVQCEGDNMASLFVVDVGFRLFCDNFGPNNQDEQLLFVYILAS